MHTCLQRWLCEAHYFLDCSRGGWLAVLGIAEFRGFCSHIAASFAKIFLKSCQLPRLITCKPVLVCLAFYYFNDKFASEFRAHGLSLQSFLELASFSLFPGVLKLRKTRFYYSSLPSEWVLFIESYWKTIFDLLWNH